MPALVIRDLPTGLHRKLKEMAARERRSMNQQALVLLEQGIARTAAGDGDLLTPFRGPFPMTKAFVDRAKRAGRS